MKYVSLFAGIGGFDLALNRLGHQNVYTNEWDKYATQTYEKNFGHKPDTRDIRTVGVNDIPKHDLLVGGFPRQAFSIAGKRRGFDETRGTLFFEICRIIKSHRTKYLLLENVAGLLSHDNGKTFTTIIRSLDELGYDCQWQMCNSKNFGVPQNRERIYIVGHLRGEPRPKIFPLLGKRETSIGGDEQFIDLQLEGAKITKQTRTIQARYYKGYSSRYGENSGVISGTLRTFKDGAGFRKIKSGLSPTVTARGREDGNGQPVIYKDMKIRRLTPLECERLQGFPDNWTEGVSDTQRYKQLGNAVTVNVVYEVAKHL